MAATTQQEAQQVQQQAGDGLPRSIFVDDNADVYDVPMSVIRRPIPSVLDEGKVRQEVEGTVCATSCVSCMVCVAHARTPLVHQSMRAMVCPEKPCPDLRHRPVPLHPLPLAPLSLAGVQVHARHPGARMGCLLGWCVC